MPEPLYATKIMIQLPPYVTRELIHERLPLIFPEGTPNRNYCIREMAASTIFTMLYIGAIEGNETYLAPVHVYRMTSEQAVMIENDERAAYKSDALKKGFQPIGNRWYADNTREPIRDETLREGLVQIGAVQSLTNLPTTSSKPRYFLQKDFVTLFDPKLTNGKFEKAVKQWQEHNLSASARTRLSLAGRSAQAGSKRILVTFPNGEARNLSAGPSSEISKSVVEVFAQIFLENPAVLWLSTSDAKVTYVDDAIASAIGLKIEADKNLPDIILVDLAKKDPLLIFIEVVATDGAVTERRQTAIYKLTDTAGFKRGQVVFLTAYNDRQAAGFKKTISDLAWNSFAWFVSEPDKIVVFRDGAMKISNMLF
jgi:hypothetical protein